MSGKPTDAKKLFARIKKFIKDNPSAVQISDVCNACCSKDVFYKYFPTGSEKYNEIVDALEENRINTKMRIRDRLLDLNQAAGLIALYKLLGTEAERVALSNIKVDKKGDGEITSASTITLTIS